MTDAIRDSIVAEIEHAEREEEARRSATAADLPSANFWRGVAYGLRRALTIAFGDGANEAATS